MVEPALRSGGRAKSPPKEISITAILLAAGKASRMGEGGPHKLLAEFDGIPLVRRCAETALAAGVEIVVAVTGYRRDEIAAVLCHNKIRLAYNPDYASGMASSLRTGFSAPEIRPFDGVLVLLADMPGLTTDDLKMLIDRFRSARGSAIVRAVSKGKPGNPVIFPQSLAAQIMRLEGDVGARAIIETSGLSVLEVDIGDAAHLDVDTVAAVLAAGGIPKA